MKGLHRLEEYCSQTTELGALAWSGLATWHAAFDGDPRWKLVRRNIERECVRKDVVPDKWNKFLCSLVEACRGGNFDDDPCAAIDTVLKRKEGEFFLSGREMDSPPRVSTYLKWDHWIKTYRQQERMDFSFAREPRGEEMVGQMLGRAGKPVWCTCGTGSELPDAASVRNRLGLEHHEEGTPYVRVTYGYEEVLKPRNIRLHAPTFLDAYFAYGSSEMSFVFQKREEWGGGPDWGKAYDLSGAGAGCAEALHEPFMIGAIDGRLFDVKLGRGRRVDPKAMLAGSDI